MIIIALFAVNNYCSRSVTCDSGQALERKQNAISNGDPRGEMRRSVLPKRRTNVFPSEIAIFRSIKLMMMKVASKYLDFHAFLARKRCQYAHTYLIKSY